MTVSAQTGPWFFTAAGSSGSFSVPATIFDADALSVAVLDPTTHVVSSPAFSVVLADDYSGATVSIASGLTAGQSVGVFRVPITRQSADLGYDNRTVERQLDRGAEDLAALFASLRRAIRGPLGEDLLFGELPAAALRAGQVLGFDGDGLPTVLANVPVSPELTLGTIWQTALLTSTEPAARAALGAIGVDDDPSITGTFDFTGGRIKMPTRAAGDDGTDGASTAFVKAALSPLLRGLLAGLGLSNDGGAPNTVLDVAAGVAVDSTNTTAIALGAFTKSTAGSWVAGSGLAGMGQGLTIANGTWYHVFAIIASGAADVYFDTSAAAANAPAGTTAFRRIGSFLTDGSSHIVRFLQDGDHFWWKVPVQSDGGAITDPGIAAVTRTLTVPTGVNVQALIQAVVNSAGAQVAATYFSDLAVDDVAPVIGGGVFSDTGSSLFDPAVKYVRTNTSAQIRSRLSFSDGGTGLFLNTLGWIDRRGRG